MATSQNALQALIDALQAVAATVPAGESEAKRAVLLSAAIEKLAATTTLEAEILATVDAILTSFDAQGVAQVASLAAAQIAVTVAKDALLAQAANIGVLLGRQGAGFGVYTGLPGLRLSTRNTNTGYQNNTHTISVRPAILDKRVGKVFGGNVRLNLGYQIATRNPIVHSYDDGLWSILNESQGNWNTNNQISTGDGITPIASTEFFLPLALSAADATTKMTFIYASGWAYQTNDMNGCSFFQTRNENNWATLNNNSPSNERPLTPHFWAYDRTNKTLVYLANTNGQYTGTTGGLTYNGEPPATSQVRELFANGTTRQVTGNPIGWAAWFNYVNADPSRFMILAGPDKSTDTYNNANANTIRKVLGYRYNRPDMTQGVSMSTGYDASGRTGADGSYKWISGNFSHSFYVDSSDPEGLVAIGGALRVPQIVINANGSVEFWSIYYTPLTELYVRPSVGSTTSDAASGQAQTVVGYDFVVLDATNTRIASGTINVDPMIAFGVAASPGDVSQDAYSKVQIGLYMPWAWHPDDSVMISFSGDKRFNHSYNGETGLYFNRAFLIPQKIFN